MKMTTRWALGILLGGACASSWAAEPSSPSSGHSSAPAAGQEAAVARVSAEALAARLEDRDPDLVVLDVRTKEEYTAGHVPGARNVSHDQLTARISELAALKDKEVVLYCRSGRRAQLAAQTLRDAGFTRLLQLEGDYPGWEASRGASPPTTGTD
jgi:rhodanese-related sulfurtransferase